MRQLIEKRIAEYEAAHAELECLIERHQDIPVVIEGSDEIIVKLRMQQLTIKERLNNLRSDRVFYCVKGTCVKEADQCYHCWDAENPMKLPDLN